MIEFIAQGVGIGFSAGTSPGPFQAYTINNSMAQGWRKSIILSLVPILTDIPLIVLVVFVLGAIPAGLIRVLQFLGGFVLLWIAWGAWKQWHTAPKAGTGTGPQIADASRLQILRGGVLMGLLSPGPYLFWGTVNGPILIKALHQSILQGAAFLVGFYGTFGVLIALTVLISARLGQLDARFTRGLILVTIVVLVVFAISLIVQGLSG